jgi:hypothetical protein
MCSGGGPLRVYANLPRARETMVMAMRAMGAVARLHLDNLLGYTCRKQPGGMVPTFLVESRLESSDSQPVRIESCVGLPSARQVDWAGISTADR